VQNNYSAAYGIGADGTIVGESEKALDFVPVVWPAGTTAAVELGLGTLVAPAAAYGIDGARIVGEATNAGKPVAVVWAGASAAPVALPGLGGDSSSAYASRGDKVVGELTTGDGAARGAVWTLDAAGNAGAPAVLPPLTGHVSSIALGVNTAGDIVGESTSAAGEVHAVVWQVDGAGVSGPATDLGVGSASAVNDLDLIAGYRGGTNQPTLWTLLNLAVPDPLFSGSYAFTQVYGINAGAALVGVANDQGFVALPQ
jgi:probable HAF family extracellular repeat protein